MTDWQPGDVALCVDDRHPKPGYLPWPPIVAGKAYTVLKVVMASTAAYGPKGITPVGSLVLRLIELRNPSDIDDGFDARRFIKQPSLVTDAETETEREKEMERR